MIHHGPVGPLFVGYPCGRFQGVESPKERLKSGGCSHTEGPTLPLIPKSVPMGGELKKYEGKKKYP